MKVNLLGEVKIEDGPKSLAENQLFLLVAAVSPKLIDRSVAADLLWPDEPKLIIGNRLRVAISRLRQLNVILLEQNLLRLNREICTTDIELVREQLAISLIEPDAPDEKAILTAQLSQLEKRLFDQVAWPWCESFRSQWENDCGVALSRLVELSRSALDWPILKRAALAGIIHAPTDSQFWSQYAEASRHLGELPTAKREFARKRRELKLLDDDFESNLLDTMENLQPLSPVNGRVQFSTEESELLSGFIARCMSDDPQLVVSILGSPSFREEIVKNPVQGLSILQTIPLTSVPDSEAKERIEVRILTSLSMVGKWRETIEVANAFLKRDINPSRRRIALLNASFAQFQIGNVEIAFEYIDQAIQIAVETGFDYDAWQCRAQKASFLLLSNRVDEAVSLYNDALEFLEKADGDTISADTLQIQGNLGLALAHQGNFRLANSMLSGVQSHASVLAARNIDHLFGSILAWTFAEEAMTSAALSYLRRALKAGYTYGPDQVIAVLGYAGQTLRAIDVKFGNSLLSEWHGLALSCDRPLTGLELARVEQFGLNNEPIGHEQLPRIVRRILQEIQTVQDL